jgi:hypothetical protein
LSIDLSGDIEWVPSELFVNAVTFQFASIISNLDNRPVARYKGGIPEAMESQRNIPVLELLLENSTISI